LAAVFELDPQVFHRVFRWPRGNSEKSRTDNRLKDSSDEELLLRARRGDHRAFDDFVERHSASVFGWMVRAVGVEDAEDLAQEIFFRAFRGLGGYRGDAPARAWLASIAHNAVKNRYRFRGRFRRIFSPAPELERVEPPAREDPEADASAEESRRFVSEALRHLPEEFRMPVILRDLEGWNYEEIAVSLQLPVGTVKSRIARGRGRLKEILAPVLSRPKGRS
jgi:RNA polymerase sigma-70 factor, ECF subfamily